MNRRTTLFAVVMLSILGTAACQDSEGGSVASSEDWTETRQQQIDLVTNVARETSTDPYTVIETIGPCEGGDDLDKTIGSSNYVVTARPAADIQDRLDRTVRPRLESDGWEFRDRSDNANQLEGTGVDYHWTRGEASLTVTISPGDDEQPVIQVDGVSECGQLGDVIYNVVQRDDPWYLAPKVEGPTIDDNRTAGD